MTTLDYVPCFRRQLVQVAPSEDASTPKGYINVDAVVAAALVSGASVKEESHRLEVRAVPSGNVEKEQDHSEEVEIVKYDQNMVSTV